MGAVSTKALADLSRRRTQTAVLAVVLFLASGAATLALSILEELRAPFDHAFTNAHGAHLVIDYASSLTDAQLAATMAAGGVAASAGPWPVDVAGLGHPDAYPVDGLAISGRGAPDGPVDRLTISAGRWWEAPGEIVVDQDTATILSLDLGSPLLLYPSGAQGEIVVDGGGQRPVPIGKGLGAAPPEAVSTLTVVGIAKSVSTPDVAGWMSPADIALLTPGAAPDRQVLYRVDPGATEAELSTASATITASLPVDSVVGTHNYLQSKADVSQTADLYVPILLAFSVFALLAAAFTIANVVSGVVLANRRDIGVMKAVGYTPGQVSTTLMAQVLAPVVVGTTGGVVVGLLASQPTIASTARSFGLPGSASLSPLVAVVVVCACLLVTFIAAAVPAVHAGRLSVVSAITRGTAPSARPDGGRMRRLGLRVPASLPVQLGVASGAAHPGRAAMTLGALLVGVAAATFAFGTTQSLVRAISQLDRDHAAPVRVELLDPSLDPQAVTDLIAARSDTARFAAIGETQVSARGLGVIPFVGYPADSGWVGYELIHGRWFGGPGEAVAPTAVFARLGAHVGDRIDVGEDGRSMSLRLVGEIFDTAEESEDHLVLRGAWADLVTLDPEVKPSRWEIQPTPDTDAHDLSTSLSGTVGPGIAAYTLKDSSDDEEFLLFLSVITFMGVVLVAISLGGVFNTVLLETRQRTREMAVLKAVGLTPTQVVVMVVSSVVPVGLLAGLLGVPVGMAFQRAVLAYIGETAVRTAIPESTFDVFPSVVLGALALAGLAMAAIGAYLPAQRAARARIAPVLQAE